MNKALSTLLPYLLLLCSCSDLDKKYYTSKKNAVRNGAIAEGRLPVFLPDSSRSITSRRLPDGQFNGEFYFSQPDYTPFIKKLIEYPSVNEDGYRSYHHQQWTFSINSETLHCAFNKRPPHIRLQFPKMED